MPWRARAGASAPRPDLRELAVPRAVTQLTARPEPQAARVLLGPILQGRRVGQGDVPAVGGDLHPLWAALLRACRAGLRSCSGWNS